jgi:glyoxylase-like metal-dependent hydrolase (beta-lactamase superfamily II)
VDEIASANGVSNKVNYLIYSHYHADHAGASSLFDKNVIRIGHEETRRVLLRDDDPARPPNEETFHDAGKAGIGGVIWRLRCVRWTRRSGGARPAGGYSPTATRPTRVLHRGRSTSTWQVGAQTGCDVPRFRGCCA